MPVRTRACSTCRKKRIRCDGTLPQCLMCLRLGKACPGPLQGPLIVDMTADAKHGMKKRGTITHARPSEIRDPLTDRTLSPPVQDAVIKVFYANFMTHFTLIGEGQDIGNELTWLQRLPDLATEDSSGVLVLALEATATAYGAIMSSQATLNKRARDLYGTALRLHHGLLQSIGSQKHITIHMVSTSVLLSFFEAMQATTADAYHTHIHGTAELLQLTGPGDCAHGVLCQLYYHVRTQLLFLELASGKRSKQPAAKKILYDTLQYERLPLVHRLMCYIAILGTFGNATHDTKTAAIQAQIEQLWSEHIGNKHPGFYGAPAEFGTFSDAFGALTVAFFSSAFILIAVRGSKVVEIENSSQHCQLILNAARYLDTDRKAIAFMRMSTPLLIVALYSQQQECRTSATAKFAIWSGRSMRGVSALALNAIRRSCRITC